MNNLLQSIRLDFRFSTIGIFKILENFHENDVVDDETLREWFSDSPANGEKKESTVSFPDKITRTIEKKSTMAAFTPILRQRKTKISLIDKGSFRQVISSKKSQAEEKKHSNFSKMSSTSSSTKGIENDEFPRTIFIIAKFSY